MRPDADDVKPAKRLDEPGPACQQHIHYDKRELRLHQADKTLHSHALGAGKTEECASSRTNSEEPGRKIILPESLFRRKALQTSHPELLV